MLRRGLTAAVISKAMHCNHGTVAKIRREIGGRPRRPGIRLARGFFEDIPSRVARAIPWNFPPEMRDDLQQEIALSVIEAINQKISEIPEQVKRYRRLHSRVYDISLDSDNYLAERLAG